MTYYKDMAYNRYFRRVFSCFRLCRCIKSANTISFKAAQENQKLNSV